MQSRTLTLFSMDLQATDSISHNPMIPAAVPSLEAYMSHSIIIIFNIPLHIYDIFSFKYMKCFWIIFFTCIQLLLVLYGTFNLGKSH